MIIITKEDFNLEEEFKKIHSKRNGAYSFFFRNCKTGCGR